MRAAGLRLTHVPYRGVIPAMNDVIAGHIPVMVVGLAGSLGAIRAGLLRAIAMTGPKRAAELPDVPTLAEKGIAGFPAEPWTAFFAPAATPAPILARLSGGLVEALNDAGVREKLKAVMEVRDQHARRIARHGRARHRPLRQAGARGRDEGGVGDSVGESSLAFEPPRRFRPRWSRATLADPPGRGRTISELKCQRETLPDICRAIRAMD